MRANRSGIGTFDVENYIKASIYDIWNKKMVGNIYQDYAPNAKVFMAAGQVLYGREQMSVEVLQRLCAFPDTKMVIDDVIWTGNERDGYRTSVRLRFEGTNTGPSVYGEARGHKISNSMIINSYLRIGCPTSEPQPGNGQAFRVNEYIQFDELNLIKQLGFEPGEIICRLNNLESAKNQYQDIVIDESDRAAIVTSSKLSGNTANQADGFDAQEFVLSSVQEIWNRRQLGLADKYYARSYRCHGASGREFENLDEYVADILKLMFAFPDLRIFVDDLLWNGNDREGYRTSMRWTVMGTHLGPEVYGMPTGKRIRFSGITNQLIKNAKFVEEWTEFGEFDVMRQLYTTEAAENGVPDYALGCQAAE